MRRIFNYDPMNKLLLFSAVVFFNISFCRAQKSDTLTQVNFYDVADSMYLSKIDSLVNDAVEQRAFPGCRIIAASRGRVFLNKSYGTLAYNDTLPVTYSTLYDLASVTKIAASALCLMKLDDDGLCLTNNYLSDYFHKFGKKGKSNISVAEVLAHQAGLPGSLNFVQLTQDCNGQPSAKFYSSVKSRKYSFELSDSLFLSYKTRKKILNKICQTAISKRGKYLYSDLSFYLYPEIVNKLSGKSFEQYLESNFYDSLGMKSTCFNPLRQIDISRIAPTENDTLFRKTLVRGRVHDEGAALCGGVSGHAGLFSTADDMAVLMQMLLNGGTYGGNRYLSQEVVDKYTSRVFDGNRRGLCFDKPLLSSSENGTPSVMASSRSFGHTGFTGCFVWADPQDGLLLVFLCNAVCPYRSKTLTNINFRTKLHDILYKSLKQ